MFRPFKNRFFGYLIVWSLSSLLTVAIIISQTENIFLRLIGFPSNIMFVFIVVKLIEKKRLSHFLELEYPQVLTDIKTDDLGNIVTIDKIRMSETLMPHLEIPEVLMYHKWLMFFQVWSVFHILIFSIAYLGN